jgi:5-formyltetrahydrofolate cyclo-ligase
MTNSHEKWILRSRMKQLRSELPINCYRQWSMTIMDSCVMLREWNNATTVHIYVSVLNNEVDTTGLIFTLFDKGKRVVVPRCADEPHRLLNIRINSFEEMHVGKFGLMEPQYKQDSEVPAQELDLIIVPVLAFDKEGGRLGFGGGYYDNLLRECSCPKIGLAYSFQEVEKVPVEPHDEKLDSIITEKDIIRVCHEYNN